MVLLVKVVPSSSISVAIEQGEYDIAINFSATKMEEIKDFENITILRSSRALLFLLRISN